jgi:hypothetical protein
MKTTVITTPNVLPVMKSGDSVEVVIVVMNSEDRTRLFLTLYCFNGEISSPENIHEGHIWCSRRNDAGHKEVIVTITASSDGQPELVIEPVAANFPPHVVNGDQEPILMSPLRYRETTSGGDALPQLGGVSWETALGVETESPPAPTPTPVAVAATSATATPVAPEEMNEDEMADFPTGPNEPVLLPADSGDRSRTRAIVHQLTPAATRPVPDPSATNPGEAFEFIEPENVPEGRKPSGLDPSAPLVNANLFAADRGTPDVELTSARSKPEVRLRKRPRRWPYALAAFVAGALLLMFMFKLYDFFSASAELVERARIEYLSDDDTPSSALVAVPADEVSETVAQPFIEPVLKDCTGFTLLHGKAGGPEASGCFIVGCDEGYAVAMKWMETKWDRCPDQSVTQDETCVSVTDKDGTAHSRRFKKGQWKKTKCTPLTN